ncbi:MAG TPA: four helix bundle protein [Candidatus Saccharimonadales bacterium]|jgi:four helix bundle protein|nr:four helix bundle protein [Candidatus Saccharimonadales bacterium]
MKINRFSDLTVWQKAHELTLATYRLTEKFPRSEQYGIVSQLRRSSASVSANIAEGFGRRTTKELLRCLQISRGELEETRYFLILSRDLQHISSNDFENMNGQCDSVGQLINALGGSLKNCLHSPEA